MSKICKFKLSIMIFLILSIPILINGKNVLKENELNQDNSTIFHSNTATPTNLQLWNRTWGGINFELSKDVVIDGENNIYICGYTKTYGTGNNDIYLVKYNSTGSQLWNRTWGGIYDDYGNGIAVDGNNNVYLAGDTASFGEGPSDAIFIKFDKLGNQLWNRTWGGPAIERGKGVAVDGNNDIYFTGYTESFGAGYNDVFLVKYDSMGNQLWNSTWGGPSNDYGEDIIVDGNNNVYFIGDTGSFGAMLSDIILVKYNSIGNQLWNKTWGEAGWEFSSKMAIDKNNNIYFTGDSSSPGNYDAILVKYDSSGNFLWNRFWGGSKNEIGYGIAIDGTNNIYITGYTESYGVGNDDALTVKYNAGGIQLWNDTWGGSNNDQAYGVAVDGNNNYYLSGTTFSFGAGDYDAFLIKYGIDTGNASYLQYWNRTWGGINYDCGEGIAVDGNNDLYLIGYTNSFGVGNCDIMLIKYDVSGSSLWYWTWGGFNDDIGCDVVVDHNNDLLLSGYTDSYDSGSYDALLMKYDAEGHHQWYQLWGGVGDDFGEKVAIDGNNNIYLVGVTSSFGINSSAFLVKYNTIGNQVWNHTWGGSGWEGGYGVAIDGNNHVYIVGSTTSIGAGNLDVFLVKYDEMGNQLWNRTWGGPKDDEGVSIAVDGNNDIYLTGYTDSFGVGPRNMILLKYDSLGNQLWNRTWGGVNYDLGWDIKVDGNNNVFITGFTTSFGKGNADAFFIKYNSIGNQLYYRTWGGLDSESGFGIGLDGSNNIIIGGYTQSFGVGNGDFVLIKYELDSDNDGLSDNSEINIYRTQPWNPDTDNDGIKDGSEVQIYTTNPNDADSDNDGLNDGSEVYIYHTNPNNVDSDSDELIDGFEVNTLHTSPINNDTDADGMPDGWEVRWTLDPCYSNSGEDPDQDGLTNIEEYHIGTAPLQSDTDGDGYNDGYEVKMGTNPLDPNDPPPPRKNLILIIGMIGITIGSTALEILGLKYGKNKKYKITFALVAGISGIISVLLIL